MSSYIRHTVQLTKKDDLDGYGWRTDDDFFAGWFNHNPGWDESPNPELVKSVQEKAEKLPHLKYRIVTDIKSTITKVKEI